MAEKINLPNLNRIIIAGRVTKDAEKRYTSDNTGVIGFRLASSKRFKDKSGEWKDNPLFISVSYFTKFEDGLEKKLKTGTPVIVEGSLEANNYEDKRTHEKKISFQIRATKIYFLSRETAEYEGEGDNSYEKVIDDVEKDFNEIEEIENGGTDESIPF
uniref:Single-stranded DNA-binding protein n=1 Tax=candidate division WOR-3 bacterium TaxID=2052148 RepID=A0A7C3N621_UNCW3